MITALVIITIVYVLFMFFLLYGFHQVNEISAEDISPATSFSVSFSVIIPYRNEADNLPQLFTSLAELRYPVRLFEVILVNDASEDDSEARSLEFQKKNPGLRIRLLRSERKSASPKKDALTTAIQSATGDYILTTDADCTLPLNWLESYDKFIRTTGNKLVAGPVRIRLTQGDGYSESFQELDFYSLQAATIGAFGNKIPFLCNGANLCYEKAAFLHVQGFEKNNHIASGDDVFLLGKFMLHNLPCGFLKNKEAIVFTGAQPDWRSLISQRIRWAAKTPAYETLFSKAAGLLVLLMNAGLVTAFFSMIFGKLSPATFFMFFLFKFNTDFILIYSSAKFFDGENSMKNYFWCSFIYPFFSTYVALFSLFTSYHWKGRRFKK